MATLEQMDTRSLLSKVPGPTLVIHGRQDVIFSLEEHESIVAAVPNATLAIIEDCGHGSPMERPQAVTALLRYWLSYG
jgi:pimeloyl-ACP methyl ester carboxylesterase